MLASNCTAGRHEGHAPRVFIFSSVEKLQLKKNGATGEPGPTRMNFLLPKRMGFLEHYRECTATPLGSLLLILWICALSILLAAITVTVVGKPVALLPTMDGPLTL